MTAWQRALVWGSWLLWVWCMWRNSANTSMGGAEWLSLLGAIAVTIVCKQRPLGVPAVFIEKPEEVRGEFESRTNWALVLIGAAILLGGIASAVRIVTHLATGFATVKDIFNDIGVFIVEWWKERLSGGTYDGELEKTQAYIFVLMLIPGFFMVLINLGPFFLHRARFVAGEHGELTVKRGRVETMVRPGQYAVVAADSSSIEFKDSEAEPAAVEVPTGRVFSVAKGTRVEPKVIVAWLRGELEKQGYAIERRTPQGMAETSWIARRPV